MHLKSHADKAFALFGLILLLIMVPGYSIAVLWSPIPIDQLFEESDVIVAGKVAGFAGVGTITGEKINYDKDELTSVYEKTKVKAYYYLKGNLNDKEIIVGTPENFWLYGTRDGILLFLNRSGSIYIPPSPYGVFSIKANKESFGTSRARSGKDLLKIITISHPWLSGEDMKLAEKYISESKVVSVVDSSPGKGPFMALISASSASFLLICALFIVLRRRTAKR